SGLVGSTPSLTRNGRPSASFWPSSASLMICALPCLRKERASSGCMWKDAETGGYLFLFNNSRTCSRVSGLSCSLSAFWLLPGWRKGRLPPKEVVCELLPFSGATRVPEEAAARWIISAFINGEPPGTFVV